MTAIVLGDDHAVFVDALAAVLLRHGIEVAASAGSVAGTIASVRRTHPDLCLLDRHFPDGDGIDAIAPIRAACGRTRVLILTADHDQHALRRATEAGAAGYLHKTRGVPALVSAIGRVARGEVVVDMPAGPARRRSAEAADAFHLAGYLTARERECLALMVDGLSTAAMVHRLGVSSRTVRTHVQAVLTKLGVHSRLEAASFAVRHDLLDQRPDRSGQPWPADQPRSSIG